MAACATQPPVERRAIAGRRRWSRRHGAVQFGEEPLGVRDEPGEGNDRRCRRGRERDPGRRRGRARWCGARHPGRTGAEPRSSCPATTSARLCFVIANSIHRVSSGAQRRPYSSSASGVSRSGSTEKETKRTRGSRMARWTWTIFAVTTGHTLLQWVKMKSAIHTEPRSSSELRFRPAWSTKLNRGSRPERGERPVRAPGAAP